VSHIELAAELTKFVCVTGERKLHSIGWLGSTTFGRRFEMRQLAWLATLRFSSGFDIFDLPTALQFPTVDAGGC
jgi:hypothetical protein